MFQSMKKIKLMSAVADGGHSTILSTQRNITLTGNCFTQTTLVNIQNINNN